MESWDTYYQFFCLLYVNDCWKLGYFSYNNSHLFSFFLLLIVNQHIYIISCSLKIFKREIVIIWDCCHISFILELISFKMLSSRKWRSIVRYKQYWKSINLSWIHLWKLVFILLKWRQWSLPAWTFVTCAFLRFKISP